jgi:hypothetical protein
VADIGEPVLWNGQTHAAIITSIESLEILQRGGFTKEYDFSVKIPKGTLGTLSPMVNEGLRFDGKTYRISRVSDSPSYPMVTLTVQAEAQPIMKQLFRWPPLLYLYHPLKTAKNPS